MAIVCNKIHDHKELVKPSLSTPRKLAFRTTFVAKKASFLVMSSFWGLSGIFTYLFLIRSMHSIRLGLPGNKILTRILKFTNVTWSESWHAQKAGTRKLGLTDTVPKSCYTQKAGMVAKNVP